jgi:hypothetical protein
MNSGFRPKKVFGASNLVRAVVLTAAALFSLGPVAAEDKPMFLELFTSQGCSSCPPADALLKKISTRSNVVAVSLPVDYWDYIGWKDTFASAQYTARQRAYAKTRGDGHVYTPQVVVNGLAHAVGSDQPEIQKVANTVLGQKGSLTVDLKIREEDGKLIADIGAAPAGTPDTAALVLMLVAQDRTVMIGRGENAGKSLSYTNVVRQMTKVGDWNGTAKRIEIPASQLTLPDTDGYVLVLQVGTIAWPGSVLAAAKSKGL